MNILKAHKEHPMWDDFIDWVSARPWSIDFVSSNLSKLWETYMQGVADALGNNGSDEPETPPEPEPEPVKLDTHTSKDRVDRIYIDHETIGVG